MGVLVEETKKLLNYLQQRHLSITKRIKNSTWSDIYIKVNPGKTKRIVEELKVGKTCGWQNNTKKTNSLQPSTNVVAFRDSQMEGTFISCPFCLSGCCDVLCPSTFSKAGPNRLQTRIWKTVWLLIFGVKSKQGEECVTSQPCCVAAGLYELKFNEDHYKILCSHAWFKKKVTGIARCFIALFLEFLTLLFFWLYFDFNVQFVTQTAQTSSADVRIGTFGRTMTAGPTGPVMDSTRMRARASLVFQPMGNTANPKQVTLVLFMECLHILFLLSQTKSPKITDAATPPSFWTVPTGVYEYEVIVEVNTTDVDQLRNTLKSITFPASVGVHTNISRATLTTGLKQTARCLCLLCGFSFLS